MKYLIEDCRVPVDARTDKERTALHEAASAGETDCVRFLIEQGQADAVDAADNENKQKACLETVRYLAAHGADINAKDEDLRAPLHESVWYGLPLIAQGLIDLGANVNASDFDGVTPLIWAAERNDEAMTALLLKNGARADVSDKSGHLPSDVTTDDSLKAMLASA